MPTSSHLCYLCLHIEEIKRETHVINVSVLHVDTKLFNGFVIAIIYWNYYLIGSVSSLFSGAYH